MLFGGIYYYDEEGTIYSTKIEAIKSGKQINFYYHDDHFSKQLWTIEPTESLQELYKQRAQWIRDNYEYVVVCYSGGADSTQVLESFYYNDIHIDEILVVGALSQDTLRGSDENHNGDLYHNVFPTLNSMSFKKTKITIVDYTEYFKDPNFFTLLKLYGPEYYNHIGSWTSVHNIFWYDLDKIIKYDKNIAYVFGAEKPKQSFNDNLEFKAFFQDMSFTDYGFRYQYSNGRRVNFFSDPQASKLMIKQHHVVKKYFERNIIGKDPLVNAKFQENYFENIRSIIYDLRNPLKFESKKSVTNILSARDKYLLNAKDSQIYSLFQQGLVKMNKDLNINKRYSIKSKEYPLN